MIWLLGGELIIQQQARVMSIRQLYGDRCRTTDASSHGLVGIHAFKRLVVYSFSKLNDNDNLYPPKMPITETRQIKL